MKVDFNNDAIHLSDAESEANEVKICLRNAPGLDDAFVIVSPKHFVVEWSSPEISCPSTPKIHGNMWSLYLEGCVLSILYLQTDLSHLECFFILCKALPGAMLRCGDKMVNRVCADPPRVCSWWGD